MIRIATLLNAAIVAGLLCWALPAARAAINTEQRKELTQIRESLADVTKLIREKKYDEAAKLVDDAGAKVEKIIKDANVKVTDPAVAPVQLLIDRRKQELAKLTGTGKGSDDADEVSFMRQIAPLLRSKCVSCHDDNAAGKLRLDSYAEMKKPGKSGFVLQAGQPQRSLIMVRVTAPAAQRMPKDAAPLTREEIDLLANWIKQGAKFDGEDESVKLTDIGKPGSKKNQAPVKINKATGKEKVKFIRDIAPDIVSLCTRCHAGQNPRSGFRVVTFEDIMRGGDSGVVIEPGSLDNSRLWELINGGPPRMPPGQLRIRRKWYADLKTWIEEGARYDGDDPKVPLVRLVPSEDEIKLEKLSKLTQDEFIEMHKEQTLENWKKALTNEPAREVETAELYVYGNASEERLKQIASWGDAHIKELRTTFRVSSGTVWRGKLTVFVYKDRFGYSEFSQTINNREPDPAVIGHSVVTTGQEEAYVVIQDVGDTANAIHADTRLNLIDQMTGAFLKREGKALPEWLIRGTGLVLATREVGENEFLRGLRTGATDALRGIEKPDDIFASGKFSPTDMAPIGYTLVSFMIREAGLPKFVNFVSALQSGSNVPAAVNSVYKPATAQGLATAYLGSLGNAGAAAKKKGKK